MPTPKTKRTVRLFRDLVEAAKTLDGTANAAPEIHHHPSGMGDPETDWEADQEETFRLLFPQGTVFHLQIRLERLGNQDQWRVIIFGRRVKGVDYASGNTQRATFNSDHEDETGFWLRPNLDSNEKAAMAERLSGPGFPRWDGRRIQLGSDIGYVSLRRFLIALAVIEEIKGSWIPGPLPFSAQIEKHGAEFDSTDLYNLITVEEGIVSQISVRRRSRCLRLLGEAREYFRSLNSDGELHCLACTWHSPIPTRTEIVQIHHLRPLSSYPRGGRRITLMQALENLAPLCPNCHRVLESHPDGGCYHLDEFIKLVRAKHS
jgi:hypothetical protein